MQNFLGDIRYALRQFRLSPIFTITAVLTLALGISGTTAIFTLIHAVMLRSLPVSDPAGLYRIGEGNDCCVEGGPQDKWGMYSFALYERLKANAPEFEQIAAFKPADGDLEYAALPLTKFPEPSEANMSPEIIFLLWASARSLAACFPMPTIEPRPSRSRC